LSAAGLFAMERSQSRPIEINDGILRRVIDLRLLHPSSFFISHLDA
jgi:hypothetical protein